MVLDEPQENDEIVRVGSFEFHYDKSEEDLLNQTLIDYKDSWYGEGFTVSSPKSEPC